MTFIIWIGILVCISQSAMFSGLNLAFFSLTRLRLEIEAESSKAAKRVLQMRQNSNFLLTTILWGNVGVNVLLTLLSNSVMAGLIAFLFSTIVITLIGEIVPQAYFSRHALKMAALLAPILRLYQFILYPLAKPSALLLDAWLGRESIYYFKESTLKKFIHRHVKESPEIADVEGKGAMNFLAADDIPIRQEGEQIDPESVIQIEFQNNHPIFPKFKCSQKDQFLLKLHKPQKKWIVFTDADNQPHLILDADGFLRHALLEKEKSHPMDFIHKPIIIFDEHTPLGDVIGKLELEKDHVEDDVIDKDVILLWGREKKILTGADILGRLLRGITKEKGE